MRPQVVGRASRILQRRYLQPPFSFVRLFCLGDASFCSDRTLTWCPEWISKNRAVFLVRDHWRGIPPLPIPPIDLLSVPQSLIKLHIFADCR